MIPNLCLSCDSNVFSLFIATAHEKVFKFTFFQGLGFSDSKYLKEMGGYLMVGIFPVCFNVLKIGEEECDICVGLQNGSICFVSLPSASNSEYVLPTKILEIGPPRSFIKALTHFVRNKSFQEQILKIADMKANQIVVLNSRFLRLYNVYRPSLVFELDLGIELEEYKFASFVGENNRNLALGFKENLKWWICLIKVEISSLQFIAKFTESGDLVDLALNSSGIWTV